MHTIDNDEGFGLVEIVVSMFMLALLAIAFLPLLIQGMKQSVENTTRATAIQLVNEQMQLVRLDATTCAAVRTFATSRTSLTQDPRGIELQITVNTGRVAGDPVGHQPTLGACPTTFPGTIGFSTSVTRVDTGEKLAEATTLVLVTGAG